MTEMLHWYAETTGGVRQGDAPVHPGCGAVHLSADLPAGTLTTVRAELPWRMAAEARLFMNGYQTWTYSPELDRNGKLRGTDHIPGFLRKKYAFDRYGDYHFAPYGHQKGQSHGFSYCYFRKGGQFQLVASLDETPGYTILRYDSRKALLTLERDCAGVEHPGGSFPLLDLFFAEGSETEVFDGWFQAMGVKPRTEKKLAGYSSWYNRYQDITEDTIGANLYTAHMPDPDLIIRPSGEIRTSNFLLWQSAYSEYYFTDVLWPDFKTTDLDAAIDNFNNRNRRFGGV